MSFALVTDSCCDLPASYVRDARVEVISFPVIMDGEERILPLGEGITEFYAAVRAGESPSTSRISVGAYDACFRAHAAAGTPVVFLGFSSALSGSLESAVLARDGVLTDIPDAEIRIVDTRRASLAQGLLVMGAAAHRDAGADAGSLETWALAARERALGSFTLESLEHLRRGGRIPAAAATLGAMLDVRPLLKFDDRGALALEQVVRGRKRSLRVVSEHVPAGTSSTVLVGHADSPEDARVVEAAVRAAAPEAEIHLCEIGPVIGTHTGPGMVAVSWWNA